MHKSMFWSPWASFLSVTFSSVPGHFRKLLLFNLNLATLQRLPWTGFVCHVIVSSVENKGILQPRDPIDRP